MVNANHQPFAWLSGYNRTLWRWSCHCRCHWCSRRHWGGAMVEHAGDSEPDFYRTEMVSGRFKSHQLMISAGFFSISLIEGVFSRWLVDRAAGSDGSQIADDAGGGSSNLKLSEKWGYNLFRFGMELGVITINKHNCYGKSWGKITITMLAYLSESKGVEGLEIWPGPVPI